MVDGFGAAVISNTLLPATEVRARPASSLFTQYGHALPLCPFPPSLFSRPRPARRRANTRGSSHLRLKHICCGGGTELVVSLQSIVQVSMRACHPCAGKGGNANLICIVQSLADNPRRESRPRRRDDWGVCFTACEFEARSELLQMKSSGQEYGHTGD